MAPAELESHLLKHPGIADAAVIGVPDQRAGELPRAYIVAKPGQNVSPQQVHEFLKGSIIFFFGPVYNFWNIYYPQAFSGIL